MMKFITKAFILLFLLAAINSLNAQNLNQSLQGLSDVAARQYLNPVSNGFAANLNTAWVSKSPKAKLFGFDMQIGVVLMGAFMPDNKKNFDVTGNVKFTPAQADQIVNNVNWQQTNLTPAQQADARQELRTFILQNTFQAEVSGPTAIGSKNDKVKVSFLPQSFIYQGQVIDVQREDFPLNVGGVLDNYNILPFGAPQLTIGTLFGTQATIRWVPNVTINEDIGQANYFGIGIQHNPLVWLQVPFPVDLSVGFFWQHLKYGDNLDGTALEYGIYGSKTFGTPYLSVSPYAGISMQSSSMTVSYDYTIQTGAGLIKDRISFDIDGENDVKFLIGTAFTLGVINLNIDYNIAKYSTLGAGIGFTF